MTHKGLLDPILEPIETEQEKINRNLANVLYTKFRKQWDRVMSQKMCDIEPDFMGFVDTYYYLSKIIPRDWTVIDFGCAYAPQAYYFRKHKAYVGVDYGKGVDFGVKERFCFKNTELFNGSIEDYIKSYGGYHKVFAICNYVPSGQVALIRKHYTDLFVFYPQL